MAHASPHDTHELNLGQHTLILNQDGSMELVTTNDKRRVVHTISLNSEETYRLLVCLQAQWQPVILGQTKEARQWDW